MMLPIAGKTARLNRRKVSDTIAGWLFLFPLLMVFLVFVGWPLVKTVFYLGFTKYSMMSDPKWIGLKNYIKLFTQDPNAKSMWAATIRIPLMLIPLHVLFRCPWPMWFTTAEAGSYAA